MEAYKPKNYVVKKNLVFTPSNYAVINNKELLLKEIISKTGIEVQNVEIDKIT